MKQTTYELSKIVEEFSNKILDIPDDALSAKPLPHKWSKKEVLGHLIDSGSNNLRRFIVGQYDQTPPKIVYEQDFWVKVNGYQKMSKEDLISYWRLINGQICTVLNDMPEENYTKECNTSKTEISLRTLEWLAADYVKHLKHHLNQIISGSFDVIYP